MVKIDGRAIVIDAGPLIHLDELGCLDLLADFAPLIAPDVVWVEALQHRPRLEPGFAEGFQVIPVSVKRSPALDVLADTLNLDAGEIAAITLVEHYRLNMLLTDDAAARLAAESLGLRAHGTIGVLVRSVRRGLRSRDNVLDTLRTIRERSTLHVAQGLLDSVIESVATGTRG
jgi:predicted nucleic acid-binding protein